MASITTPWTLRFLSLLDNSFIKELDVDLESESKFPNNSPRPVKSGHYVHVQPTPLPSPQLIAHSSDMISRLGITEEDTKTPEFARVFGADISAIPETKDKKLKPWATPYALSISGKKMWDNDPYMRTQRMADRGLYGYGDGRAATIGEFVTKDGERWDLQWKGSGPTPFCRGADGRAILRSSIREFIASEAMYHLRVPTCRTVSLVVSGSLTSKRPWYSGQKVTIDENDPRLASVPLPFRAMILPELMRRAKEPDKMVNEKCTISVRAAPSFLRVGHFELFSRRIEIEKTDEKCALNREHLIKLLNHAFNREYPEVASFEAPFENKILQFLRGFAEKQAELTVNWLRVGFAQGNFNSDNNLINGRTMDYGPFGFIEMYDPMFAKWTGSGEHFGFINQPQAGKENLKSLMEAILILLPTEDLQREAKAIVNKEYDHILNVKMSKMRSEKFGISDWTDELEEEIYMTLRSLMNKKIDYTIFYRQLCLFTKGMISSSDDEIFEIIKPSIYGCGKAVKPKLISWLRLYLKKINEQSVSDAQRKDVMRKTNPKYVPREWMFYEAYEDAEKGKYDKVLNLQKLFLNPYGEQPEFEKEFYIQTPEAYLDKAGIAFMT